MSKNPVSTRSVAIHASMVPAALALDKIARGDGTDEDLAIILLAINLAPTDWCGIVGYDEIMAGINGLEHKALMTEDEPDWEATFERAAALRQLLRQAQEK